MTMTMRKLKICLLKIAFVTCLYMCQVPAEGAGCPGDETQGDKTQTLLIVLHGVIGPHVVWIYFDYPWNWPECYTEIEDGFDAYDEVIKCGARMERSNCACFVDQAEETKTAQVSVSFTLGGSRTSEISVALSWPGSGTIDGGTSSSINWSVNQTASGTYSLLTKDIPANTIEWWYKYIYRAHRQGREYDYVQGEAFKYCHTHGVWCGSYGGIIDYDGDMATATTKYMSADGL